MVPRRHHFVPRFLLEGFTDRDGLFYVHDMRRRRKPWRSRPDGAGHERDYYMVDVPGEAPTLAEDGLAQMESVAASLVRGVVEEHALPAGVERETLLWFIAVLAVRVPKQRDEISRFMCDTLKLEVEAAAKTQERFDQHLERMRAAGADVSGLSRDEINRALRDPAITLRIDRTWLVGQMFRDVQTLAPLLVARHWCVLVARPNTASFICSDSPVSLVPLRPAPRFRPVGWGMADTAAFVPLTCRIALYGRLDVKLPGTLHVSKDTVAMVNTATLATACRNVYSPLDDFLWTQSNGRVGHACDLPKPDQESTEE